MIKAVYRFFGVLQFAFERLVHNPGLTILALLGVILSVGLVSNAAFFAQAVDQVILDQELGEFSRMTGRPPFSTSVYTFPSSSSPISLSMAEELAQNVAGTLSAEVGLPLRHLGMQVHSGNMMLQPREGDTQWGEDDEFLGAVDIAYVEDVPDQMVILAGDPLDADGASGEVIDVWMHTRLAEKMGVNIGEELDIGTNILADTVPIRITGIWRSQDPDDDFWFENPDATLQSTLLVRRSDYIDRVQPLVPARSWYVAWHIILDDTHVYPELAQDYLQGFARAEVVINKYLPKARINTPPLDPLDSFVTRGDTLTVLLLSFNLPALGFLLYFLVLSSAIIAQWQQRETAMLVGRGMRATSILTLTFVEELLLFIVGYPVGIAAGMFLARVMGNTASFLSFTSRSPLPVALRGLNVPVTLAALVVTLVARLIPAARATRLSATDVDRAQARPTKGPLWYRAYLDFLLLIPTYYAYTQLNRRGSLSTLVEESPTDIYQDPLLILVPALFILTAGLMTLRIFPWVMRALDFIANLIPWATPHLALRQLGRRSHTYINPLLLVIVSLGLGVYTLSMAASMDQWLIDRIYYGTGTDLAFGVFPPGNDSEAVTIVSGEWIPLPANFEEVPGVEAATRVGRYPMSTRLMTSGDVRGRFLGVDRTTFQRVSWFRDDFANESLGGLMNKLAMAQNAILVSEEIYEDNELFIGDEITLRIGVNYEFYVVDQFQVVGTFKYFPTVYEDEDITFIGNLDHLNFYIGMTAPHDIWMQLEPGYHGEDVLKAIPSYLNVGTGRAGDAPAKIAEEQGKFERVGVFGTLSVGFMAAVVMAIMGLLIYTYASLRERLHRFTILRAVGLLRRQIAGQVVMEYTFLTAYGSAAGALIGKFASDLFVPLFQFTGEEGIPLPPLIPVIAEGQVRYLVIGFVAAILLLEVLVITRALSRRAFSMLKGVFG
ncbi:MAG: FtsX-like permease family protein [Anaerolineae bacterium]|nr:FtsX-like permease family protein [Anaerolineae bacterium]